MGKLLHPSVDRVRAAFRYDGDSGHLVWNPQQKRRKNKLVRAGHAPRRARYRRVRIDGVNYYEHEIIWLWLTGEWSDRIGHRNGDGFDNRKCNLYPNAEPLVRRNGRTTYSRGGGGGAIWDKARQKWFARAYKNNVSYFLGRFDTKEEADAACLAKAKELWGDASIGGQEAVKNR